MQNTFAVVTLVSLNDAPLSVIAKVDQMSDQEKPAPAFFALDLDTAAQVTCTNRRRLERAIASKKLIARKAGRATLLLPDELLAWLRSLPVVDRHHDEARAV